MRDTVTAPVRTSPTVRENRAFAWGALTGAVVVIIVTAGFLSASDAVPEPTPVVSVDVR
jgi:hypothetical protein